MARAGRVGYISGSRRREQPAALRECGHARRTDVPVRFRHLSQGEVIKTNESWNQEVWPSSPCQCSPFRVTYPIGVSKQLLGNSLWRSASFGWFFFLSLPSTAISMPEIDLRKYVMDQGNWVAVPTDVLRAMVEMLVEKSAGEVDEQTAVADMLFHASRNVFLSESDWAKRWRWTKSKAHRFLVKQRTKSEPRANQERTKSEPKSAENSLETPKSEPTANRQRTDSEPTANQPIYIDRAHQNKNKIKEEEESKTGRTRVREAEEVVAVVGKSPPVEINPNDPQQRQPTEDDVREWARGMGGVPPDAAWEIAESYNATGWIKQNGVAIRHWQSGIRSAYTYRQRNGTAKQAPTAGQQKPTTDYQRRREYSTQPLRGEEWLDLAASLPDVRPGD